MSAQPVSTIPDYRTVQRLHKTGLDQPYRSARPANGMSIATIHAALDAGVTLSDTGDLCGMEA